MGTGGRGTAKLVHVESTDQAADLFTKVLCGPMFEAQASVVTGSKRSYFLDKLENLLLF